MLLGGACVWVGADPGVGADTGVGAPGPAVELALAHEVRDKVRQRQLLP